MSSSSRRKSASVISHLERSPYSYSFFQAVRLLERSASFKIFQDDRQFANKPIACYTPPHTESIRFVTQQSLSFPSSNIQAIKQKKNHAEIYQWNMSINFMGLTGGSGVLPHHYTELVLKRLKVNDPSLDDFLQIFNHRTISLYYQAATKYRLPIEYERTKLFPPANKKTDNHSQILLSLIGLGTNNLSDRLYTRDESLIYYSGLFSQKVRTANGLKQIIQSHFKIPTDIKEFVGQWQELIDDVRTRLPGKISPQGQNNCLGKSAMLGHKGWFAQGKIRIILGPLDKSQLSAFSPGTNALKSLNEIVRLYLDMEHDYDFVIRIRRADIPKETQLRAKKPPIVGWNTWLSDKSEVHSESKETVDISISASHYL